MKGSRFIAQVAPVSHRDDVSTIIRRVREDMPDATHICYAYRLMKPVEEPRYTGVATDRPEEFATDAGEPGGSAGPPMLNVLRQAGLVDVVAWVARYFGGTKLGIPGLMAAYAEAVRLALPAETPVPWIAMTSVQVRLPYSLADRIKGELQKIGGIVEQESYAQEVSLLLKIPVQEASRFLDRLKDWGGDSVRLSDSGIDFDNQHR